MDMRLTTVAAIAALAISGCAQGGPPLAAGPAAPLQPSANYGKGLQPALELYGTPTVGSWLKDIVAGPENSMWFAEYIGQIGRIQMNGQITEFSLPEDTDAEGITIGSDGNIWFTDPAANKIGRMTPKGNSKAFSIPAYDPSPRGITRGPDGNLWYVENADGYIGRVTLHGKITRYAIPGGLYSSPWAITTGPDGNLWFTETTGDAIGRFNPNTQTFEPSIIIPHDGAYPLGIITAPDKHVWFTESAANKIAEVASSGKLKEFTIPQNASNPLALAPGKDGNLWFTEGSGAAVGSIDPKTGKFGVLVVLPSGSLPFGIGEAANKNDFFSVASDSQPHAIGELVFK